MYDAISDYAEALAERDSEWAYHAPSLADEHSHWHWHNPDRPWDCPLDCYDPPQDDEPEPLTDEQQAELDAWFARQRELDATPGPWEWESSPF